MNKGLTVTGVLVLSAAVLSAQTGDRSAVRGIGMARTVNGISRGIDAIGVNPANLALPDRGNGTIAFLPFAVQISSDLIPYEIYQEYFTGVPLADGSRGARHLTDADKHRIISEMKSGLGSTRMDFELMLFGMAARIGTSTGAGFSIKDHIGAEIVLPSDYFRFYFFGLDSSGSHYTFDGTSVSGRWWREYNFSAGFELTSPVPMVKRLFAGVGVKIAQGFGVAETERYRASLVSALTGINQYRADFNLDYLVRRSGVDFMNEKNEAGVTPFPRPAGTGIGFDLGVAAEIRGLGFHLALTNLGSIRWRHNIVETYGSYDMSIDDPFTQANQDTIETAVRGRNRPGGEFSTSMPAVLRFGVAASGEKIPWLKAVPGEIEIAFDYTQGLNSSLGNTTRPRFSLGAEYRIIPFLPLRTGMSLGGGDRFRWAAGFGLDFYAVSLDVATENLGMLFFPNDLTMLSIAAGLKIRF
ncbi:MAG TPA: DUF5723 family protein [Bacteroidota bacterium]|nr:DUF5723 family protein [Bacteroidota bacterium]